MRSRAVYLHYSLLTPQMWSGLPKYMRTSAQDSWQVLTFEGQTCSPGRAFTICPPHQPQKQAYVERYHRSYQYEGLLVHRPGTLQEASDVTHAYQEHYNWQRPHQGRSCHNVPPCIAHPVLPHLPALEASVDPDRWVDQLHGRAYVRHIGADGCVTALSS